MGSERGKRLFAYVLSNIEYLVHWEVYQEVESAPIPLFLQRLSDVAKIASGAVFGSPETVRMLQKLDV